MAWILIILLNAPLFSAGFDGVLEYLKTTTRNGGLAVSHKGHLIYQGYFGLGHADATPNLASCGKSFTSAAMGILMEERRDLFPDGLDQLVFREPYLPREALGDASKSGIKLGQLLSMTAGLRGNNPAWRHGRQIRLDPLGPDGWQAMVDETAAAVPLWCKPGDGYSYATSSIHLVSMIIRHVTGREMRDYIEEKIAKPLGFGPWGFGYRNQPLGHTPGGGGITVRAADMLKFGEMLASGGRWRGRQIVPAAYVREASRQSRFNPHFPYSLQFDVNTGAQWPRVPRDAFWKSGSGGHVLYIVPSRRLVVWKLGGRDEQYDPRNTGMPPDGRPGAGFGDVRVDAAEAVRRTIEMVLDRIP